MKSKLLIVFLIFLSLIQIHCKTESKKWDRYCDKSIINDGRYKGNFIALDSSKKVIKGLTTIKGFVIVKNGGIEDIEVSMPNLNYAKYNGMENEYDKIKSIFYVRLEGCKGIIRSFRLEDYEE